jgi:hypothetical protein
MSDYINIYDPQESVLAVRNIFRSNKYSAIYTRDGAEMPADIVLPHYAASK